MHTIDMRIHRFYISTPFSGTQIVIEDADLVHQWKHVFRYGSGAQVIVFCGDFCDHHCIINSITSHTALLNVLSTEITIMPQKFVALAFALIKKDNTEMVIQKAVELGVSEILPMITQHSEKKTLNMKRAEKIMIEATEQSGRGELTAVKEPQDLAEILESTKDQFDVRIVFHPEGDIERQSEYMQNMKKALRVLLFVGPEGGFSPFEIEQFVAAGVDVCRLGDTVLRAETASIAVLSLVLL